MLNKRIKTVLILLPLFLAALFLLPDFGWAVFLLMGILVGLFEWTKLANFSKTAISIYMILSFILLSVLLLVYFKTGTFSLISTYFYVITVIFWMLIVPLWMRFKWQPNCLMYGLVGWILLFPTWTAFVELRNYSPVFLLSLLGTVWIADSAAYFVGRRFGKHKLAPIISPNKTWEGLFGAFVVITVYGVFLASFNFASDLMGRVMVPKMAAIILMLWVLTSLSVIGDLFESMMKRQGGVKDSGNIFPGHGGMLDRIDSLTATMPIAALSMLLLKV